MRVTVTLALALWDLLASICLMEPLVAAISTATRTNVGAAGYVVAAAIGPIIGLCFTRTMYWALGPGQAPR